MTQTYFKTVALGLDDFGAAILLDRNDVTISAACGLVRRGTEAQLRLHRWQVVLLGWIGDGLEFFWPGHCEGAIENDIKRANSAISLLQAKH